MELVIQLDPTSFSPLYRQLSDALKKAIQEGRLAPGKPMPSVRSLGSSLEMSRSTVLKSYDELQSQGYIEAQTGLGTFVTKTLPTVLDLSPPAEEPTSNQRSQMDLSAYGNRLLQNQNAEMETRRFHAGWHFGTEPETLLPIAQWKQMLLRHCGTKELSQMNYSQEPFGYKPLREAVSAFLARSRAVKCTTEQVAIFSCRENRLDLLCRLLLDPGDCVALENPGYYGVRHTLVTHGAELVAVPVDDQGICVDYLRALTEKIKFVYLTPSVHEPSGVQMSLKRREELLDWARTTGAFIIEDDYDSEYRHGSNLIPAIQGLDNNDCVIYLRCFWKVMAPLVRLGFMVIPKCLVPVVALAKFKYERDVPLLEQQALTDFLNEGLLERHIKKSRAIYMKRRQALVFAVTHYIGRKVEVCKEINGMFVQVWFNTSLPDERLLQCAQQAGVPMVSTRPFYISEHVSGEFIIPFTQMNEETINSRVMRLAFMLDNLENAQTNLENAQITAALPVQTQLLSISM